MRIRIKIILTVAFVAVFAIPFSLYFSTLASDNIYPFPKINNLREILKIDSPTFSQEDNSISMNCTLVKGYNGSSVCTLLEFTIRDYGGIVFRGIPVPSALNLNETTTIKLSLGKPLPPEIYYLDLSTNSGSGSGTSMNVDNFVDPQKQIEIREILYDADANILFVRCNRIETRTDLFVVVKDSQGGVVARDMSPVRTEILAGEGTELTVSLNELLASGQYSVYLVSPFGLIKPFTIP
jgi:hypothetical protein